MLDLSGVLFRSAKNLHPNNHFICSHSKKERIRIHPEDNCKRKITFSPKYNPQKKAFLRILKLLMITNLHAHAKGSLPDQTFYTC